jgi:hypothetical protein
MPATQRNCVSPPPPRAHSPSPRLVGWSTMCMSRPHHRSSTSHRRRTWSRCPWTPVCPRRGLVMSHRMPPLLRSNHHLKVSEPLSLLSCHTSRCAILWFLRLDLSLVSTDLWCWRTWLLGGLGPSMVSIASVWRWCTSDFMIGLSLWFLRYLVCYVWCLSKDRAARSYLVRR